MKRVAAVLCALGVLAVGARAKAFVRTHVDPNDIDSPCLFWGLRTVPYQLSQRGMATGDNDAGFAALRLSFQQWTDVACSDFVYQDDGFTSSLEVGYSRAVLNQPMLVNDVAPHNHVLFRSTDCGTVVPANDACTDAVNDDCENFYDCWTYGEGVIALTTTTYNFETGQIFDADIELNESEFTFTTVDPPAPPCSGGLLPGTCISTDLRNTVTHESGHMLGLGHSADSTATMYASANTGETSKRDLAQDDINAICAIYPTGLAAQTCGDPPAGNPKGCGCGAGDGLLLAPFGILALLLRRRRVR